jgi:hypothetical protein
VPTAGRILKTQIRDRYDRNIKFAWIQGYGEPEHEFEQFYDVISTEHEDERWSYVSGLGRWSQKDFGGNVPYDSIYAGYQTIITPYTYASAFTIEEETVEDDVQGNLAQDLATNLAQTGRDTMEYLAAIPFNNATTTTYASPWQSGGDAVALLSTSHPIPAGGVWANCPAAHVDLSVAALQAARTRMEKGQNARGLPWKIEGNKLVVPTESRWLMAEILQSDKVPYTSDNTANVVRENLKGVTWSRLNVGNGAWFLMASAATSPGQKGHMMKCLMRVRPQFDRDNVFDSGDRRYKGRMRVGFGNPDPRGIDGSTGAA